MIPNSCLEVGRAYQLSKSHRLLFNHTLTRSKFSFDIIHVDLWGLAPVISINGMKYFILFVDDCTRFQWVYTMHNKSQVAHIFLHFESYVARQFNTKIYQLQSDGGTKLKGLKIHLF